MIWYKHQNIIKAIKNVKGKDVMEKRTKKNEREEKILKSDEKN
jgi:hypothetical protein